MAWKTIADDKVRTVWREPSTGNEITISPDWFEQNGTPYDATADEDMTYLRTEIMED